MSDPSDEVPPAPEVDYSKYGEDSVPPEERPIQHTHAGRPDLDYDDTPVGPAPTEEAPEEKPEN